MIKNMIKRGQRGLIASAVLGILALTGTPLDGWAASSCQLLRQQGSARVRLIETQHEQCLAQGKATGMGTDHVCSRPSCQGLHTQMYAAREQLRRQVSACEASEQARQQRAQEESEKLRRLSRQRALQQTGDLAEAEKYAAKGMQTVGEFQRFLARTNAQGEATMARVWSEPLSKEFTGQLRSALRADRAVQRLRETAKALDYAGDFIDVLGQFQEHGWDSAEPWRNMSKRALENIANPFSKLPYIGP